MPADLSIRQRAERFLRKRGIKGGHLVTSKFYTPEESRTKDQAWWVQVPWSAVRAGKTIHIVLEAKPRSLELRHLQVPAIYFIEHERHLSFQTAETLSLFLAADEHELFVDRRGPGRIPFAQFEREAGAA
jgi:hypothetical protein